MASRRSWPASLTISATGGEDSGPIVRRTGCLAAQETRNFKDRRRGRWMRVFEGPRESSIRLEASVPLPSKQVGATKDTKRTEAEFDDPCYGRGCFSHSLTVWGCRGSSSAAHQLRNMGFFSLPDLPPAERDWWDLPFWASVSHGVKTS